MHSETVVRHEFPFPERSIGRSQRIRFGIFCRRWRSLQLTSNCGRKLNKSLKMQFKNRLTPPHAIICWLSLSLLQPIAISFYMFFYFHSNSVHLSMERIEPAPHYNPTDTVAGLYCNLQHHNYTPRVDGTYSPCCK